MTSRPAKAGLTIEYHYVNDDKVRRQLHKAIGVLQKDMDKAERAAARHVKPVAQSYAPKRTGQLAGSLRINTVAPGSITAKAPYAYYVHWGTRKMQANEFLLNAAMDTRHEWSRYFKTLLEAAARTAAA